MKLLTLYSSSLVSNIARDLNMDINRPYGNPFADGELHVHFDRRFDDQEILFVQSTYPYQDRKLHEIYFTVDMLKNQLGARKVTAVIPYLAYMRQDEDFSREKGLGYDAMCAKSVLNILKGCGIDKLYVVDIHSKKLLQEFASFAENLDTSCLFAQHLEERGIQKPLIVSPDDNAEPKASKIAELLGAKHLSLDKKRDRTTGEIKIKKLKSALPSENIVIVDDIIATGRTIAESARMVKDAGAKNIIAVCTHALMVYGSERRLKGEGVLEVISTDSIELSSNKISPHYLSQISLSPLISQQFKG